MLLKDRPPGGVNVVGSEFGKVVVVVDATVVLVVRAAVVVVVDRGAVVVVVVGAVVVVGIFTDSP